MSVKRNYTSKVLAFRRFSSDLELVNGFMSFKEGMERGVTSALSGKYLKFEDNVDADGRYRGRLLWGEGYDIEETICNLFCCRRCYLYSWRRQSDESGDIIDLYGSLQVSNVLVHIQLTFLASANGALLIDGLFTLARVNNKLVDQNTLYPCTRYLGTFDRVVNILNGELVKTSPNS